MPSLRRSAGLYKEVNEFTPLFRTNELRSEQRIIVEGSIVIDEPFMDKLITEDSNDENGNLIFTDPSNKYI